MKFRFGAKRTLLDLDELHISNVVKNIVENAYKYSREDALLEIITTDFQDGVLISFKDNGTGISHGEERNDTIYR